MPTVDELKIVNEDRIRKWGTQILAIMAPDAPVPTTFFGAEDHLPILPAEAKQMGFITTDGISNETSISTESVNMVQSLEAVRTDVTGIENTLTVAFGESNAWTNALYHGVPFENWAAEKDSPWIFDDGEVSDYPYYRLLVLAQDGVGSQAFYRVEFAYKAKVTAKTARSLQRASAENFGFTFGLFKDTVAKKSYTRAENGPALNPAPVVP